jgi:hypothetical protein
MSASATNFGSVLITKKNLGTSTLVTLRAESKLWDDRRLVLSARQVEPKLLELEEIAKSLEASFLNTSRASEGNPSHGRCFV